MNLWKFEWRVRRPPNEIALGAQMLDPSSHEENLSEAKSPQARISRFLTLVKEGEVQRSRHWFAHVANGQVQAITFHDCISSVGS